MKTLSFYTTGKDMTNLIYGFLNEGAFDTFFKIMDDCGIDDTYIKLFFKGCIELDGDTRKDGLFLSAPEKPHKVDMKTAIITWLKHSDEYKKDREIDFNPVYISDFKPIHNRLKSLLGDDYIPRTFDKRQYHLFDIIGYNVLEKMPKEKKTINGIIIEDGTFIECAAYRHRSLEEQLTKMGYDEKYFLNISYNNIYGSLINELDYDSKKYDHQKIVAQFKTLKKFPIIRSKYTQDSAYKILNRYFIKHYDNGGKYGSLKFINEIYGFRTPKISKHYFNGAGFVRSSPKKSLPGLLESYMVKDEKQAGVIVKKMKSDYQHFSDLVGGNSFHYFFQEFIEGQTGVAHYTVDGEFSYALSSKNYDIVNGKSGGEKLEAIKEKELELMLKELYIYFGFDYDIQIEFCLNEKKELVVLQFRTFEVKKEKIKIPEIKGKTVCEGTSFQQGIVELIYGSEILTVTDDAEPSALVGKKALIVTGDGQYSHVLSLSRMLNIPSIYNTGSVNVDDKGTYSLISTKEKCQLIKI